MTMVARIAITITLVTRLHFSQATSGSHANKLVNVKYTSSAAINTSWVFHGTDFLSRVNNSPAKVTQPTISDQRISSAKPHKSRCGLIMLNQVQTRNPIHGRRKHTGSRPNTMAANNRSRMVASAFGFPECHKDPSLQEIQRGDPA